MPQLKKREIKQKIKYDQELISNIINTKSTSSDDSFLIL